MGSKELNTDSEPSAPLSDGKSRPIIGIRDSGVGGLTVARQVKLLLPQVPLLYFADTANTPYGDRPVEEIRYFAFSITEFLQKQGANLVIFACNTTSAYALETAREHFDIPLIGMIEDGARAAVNAIENPYPAIGVLATSATVHSGVYSQYIHQLRPGAHCIEIACPEFVPLVESKKIYSEAAKVACKAALQPLLDARVDVVILGCTHFPLLLPTLKMIAPELRFIDPAQAVAVRVTNLVKSTFGESTFTEPQDTYFASGPDDVLKRWITSLMEPTNPLQIQTAPIFHLL